MLMEENINSIEDFFIEQDKIIELNPLVKMISKRPLEECTRILQPTQCIVYEYNIMLYHTNPNGQGKMLLAELINKSLQKNSISYDQIIAILGYNHSKEYVPNKPYNIIAYLVIKIDNPSRNL